MKKSLEELKKVTAVSKGVGYNEYVVGISYRGKNYVCISHNSLAFDRLDDEELSDNKSKGGYTNRQAWQAFYDECKRHNCLGEFDTTYCHIS